MAKTKTETNKNLVKSKYVMARIAPRKVVLVANAIRGMKVGEAIRFLDFNDKKSSGIIKGIVETAIANGTHNFGFEKESMYVADIKIGPGPSRKGGRMAAKGTFKPIWKRTTHITVFIGSNSQPKKAEAKVEPVEVKSKSKKETK
jgi:large subunit ribosomal protein L22